MTSEHSKKDVGSSDDFPIKGSMFTIEMNKKIQNQNKFDVDQQQRKLDFSSKKINRYKTDFSETTALLFSHYNSENMTNDTNNEKSTHHFLYYILVLLLIPFTFISYLLGKMAAKKRLKKFHGTNNNQYRIQ